MRALVTGAAAGGIGGAICVRLARSALDQGLPAKIVACATGTNPGLAALADELRLRMAQAASNAGVDPRGLNFKHTVQLWTQWISRGLSATKDCGRLFTLIASARWAIGLDVSSRECESGNPSHTRG